MIEPRCIRCDAEGARSVRIRGLGDIGIELCGECLALEGDSRYRFLVDNGMSPNRARDLIRRRRR